MAPPCPDPDLPPLRRPLPPPSLALACAAANILVQRNNVAKIADFGISKQLKGSHKSQALGKLPAGVDHQRLTSGNRVQTLPFRAPEVFLGET